MKRPLKYVEHKTGHSHNGPAWIARVTVSKTGRTLYFNGKALKRGHGSQGNHFDLETGEEYWISNVKKDGSDRHWVGSGRVFIEAGAVEEYLAITGQSELDRYTFAVVEDFESTDPSSFYELENKRL